MFNLTINKYNYVFVSTTVERMVKLSAEIVVGILLYCHTDISICYCYTYIANVLSATYAFFADYEDH